MKKRKSAACHHQLGDHEALLLEIMSRLPVKSLMRFKCVCKHWQSTIQKDDFFIDLHFSRSKAATGTCSLLHVTHQRHRNHERNMHLLSAELVLPSGEDGRVQVRNAHVWKVPKTPFTLPDHTCTLDGLICFMNRDNNCARISNSSTRESTPWIKTPFEVEFDEGFLMGHVLGYDPATKVYKVLALWSSYEYDTHSVACEVLTVRQNSWRRIDGIPTSSPPYIVIRSVYVNGSIYLLCVHKINNNDSRQTIVEFNVGSEKFRVVETIASYVGLDDAVKTHLIAFNGRLCVLTYETDRSIKMRTLYDHCEDIQGKKGKLMTTNSTSSTTMSTSSAAGTTNHRWVEETLSLPHYHTRLYSIRHIPGTNLFIIKSFGTSYYYIWNNKSNVITLDSIEIPSSLIDEIDTSILEFDTFTPNLSLVN